MRTRAIALVAGVLAVAGAGTALAQGSWPSVTVTPSVSPHKAGTARHPQGVKLTATIHWQSLGAADQPIVTHFLILFPKGSLYNGAKYATCSRGKLNAVGPSGCPAASIMGHGTGNAYADTVITHPQITVVNGGANTVYFYTVLNNPARVEEPVPGVIKKLSGKWAYSLSITVPQDLRVVAGIPIELTYLTVTAGKGTWLSTTSCPGGHWPFQVTTDYLNFDTNATGSAGYAASVACQG